MPRAMVQRVRTVVASTNALVAQGVVLADRVSAAVSALALEVRRAGNFFLTARMEAGLPSTNLGNLEATYKELGVSLSNLKGESGCPPLYDACACVAVWMANDSDVPY